MNQINLNMYLIKSIHPIMDDYYGVYFSHTKELNPYLLTLIDEYDYECVEIPAETSFTNFEILVVDTTYTFSSQFVYQNKSLKCIILDEHVLSKNVLFKLLNNASIKNGVLKGKVEAYFILDELYFNINDNEVIQSFLKDIAEYRKTLQAKPVIAAPKKNNGVPEKIRIEKKTKKEKEKPVKEMKLKKSKHILEPFHIYRKDTVTKTSTTSEYFFVLGVVHMGYSKENVGLFKKADKKMVLWCLNLPRDYFTPTPFRESDIIESVKTESYYFEPFDEKEPLIKMNSFKEQGNLSVEELVEINNRNLISYQPLDRTDYSTHKYCFQYINYYPLVSMTGQNWLSHADYLLYIINQQYYQALLNDYDFDKPSIIAELIDIYEEPIIEMFDNWNEKYRDVYKSKNVNEPVSQEESIMNYAGFLAQHIIAKADERQLFFKEVNATTYNLDSRRLYESIKQLMIDTEQTYRFALLKDSLTLGISEPNFARENEEVFNIPNYQDSRKITTLYSRNHQGESYYEAVFLDYQEMVYYYKKKIYDSYVNQQGEFIME